MKRIAIYTRVSTDEQTTENQQAVLTEWAARTGGRVVAAFDDNGVSGTLALDKRKAGKAMLDAATRREFDQLAVWAVDRLGRSLLDLLNNLMQLQASGVDLYIHTQAIDSSTPAGKAMFQMLGVFAEFERSMIRERVLAGMARAKAAGKHCGRPTVSEEKADEIRQMRSAGVGVRKTARLCGVGVSTVQRIDKGGK